jgi:8-oxo-dGTP pyrophosphatase MutT (NUDIX family)
MAPPTSAGRGSNGYYQDISAQEIARRLSWAMRIPAENPFPPELLAGPFRAAAVLIPFLRTQEGWSLVYIRRTTKAEDRHSGQVAFPGGSADPQDQSPVDTALREAHEEIGVLQKDVQILGRLHDFVTITGYQVAPVVGLIPYPYSFQAQAEEVSRVFTIPLPWLADQRNRRSELRHLPSPYEPLPVIYFQPYDGELLWGASARFTVRLLEILFGDVEGYQG